MFTLMGRKRDFTIKEGFSVLNSYRSKTVDYNSGKRLDALILLKTNKYGTLQVTADHLGIDCTTLCKWIKRYETMGIDKCLAKYTTNKKSKIITAQIHKALEERLHNPDNPLSGYMEAQNWLKEEFGVEIEYQWLWKYMKTKLHSCLKVPRKVNVKKKKGRKDPF